MTGAEEHRAAGRRGGFTIMELVMVLLIIAMVAALGVARYGDAVQRYRADAAARRIVADMALARSKARMQSQSQAVVFNLAASSLSLPNVPDMDHPPAAYQVRLGDAPYYARLMSVNFGGASQVVFDGYGSPAASGTIVVAAGGYTKTVVLSHVTGRAAIQSGVGLAPAN
jgi:prepilin-type N-terminal cleavage/methylation domain-containing protein